MENEYTAKFETIFATIKQLAASSKKDESRGEIGFRCK